MKKFYDKSILFEVVKRSSGEVVDSFAMSIPPGSIRTSLPQRECITDTFDGVFIDDWGIGKQRISISGTTGGKRVRVCFAGGMESSMNGKDEIYAFRDRIIKYKDKQSFNGKGYEDYTIRYYDLTSSSDSASGYYDAYEVRLEEFAIERSKQKPLDYDYSIELFCVRSLIEKQKSISSLQTHIPPTVSKIKEAMNKIDAARAEIQKANEISGFIIDEINSVRDVITNTLGVVGDSLSALDSFISIGENAGSLGGETISAVGGLVTDAMTTGFTAVTFPIESMKQAMSACMELAATVRAKAELLKEKMWDDIEFLNVLSNADKMASLFGTIVTFGKSFNAVSESTVTLETEAGVQSFRYAGFIPKAVSASDSLDSMAKEYLGNASLGGVIALYNGMRSSDDLMPGMVIRIPVEDVSINASNPVYNVSHDDMYGKDIKINQSGDIVFSDEQKGVIEVADNVSTLTQAVNLRLQGELGARKRLVTYGILSRVGSMANIADYFSASIIETLLADVRILSVDNVQAQSDGDQIYYQVTMTLIYGENQVTVSGLV